jgi:hypothetical protein
LAAFDQKLGQPTGNDAFAHATFPCRIRCTVGWQVIEPESFPSEFAIGTGLLLSNEIFAARVSITVNLADIELWLRQSLHRLSERVVSVFLWGIGSRGTSCRRDRPKASIRSYRFDRGHVGFKIANPFVVSSRISRRRMRLI